MKVFVMVGFMSFIYHNIMDGISIALLLFIEESRASVITFTTLYVSLVVLGFIVLFISYSLYITFRGNLTACENIFTCLVSTFMLIAVFPAVVLFVIMYMIIVFSLNLKGVTGIVTGLIPSIALSAASWYIKKRLEKQSATSQSHIGEAMNDGEREETEDNADSKRLLSHET